MRGVSSVEGPDVDGWQTHCRPLVYFQQDHLRIDQVPTLLWLRHENKINSHLFIFILISVTLRSVSISWCLTRPSSPHAAGVSPTQPGQPGFTNASLLAQPVFPIIFFFRQPWWKLPLTWDPFGKKWPRVWLSRACLHHIPFTVPIDSAASLLPLSLSLMAACLSPCRQKQPLHLSINVLSFHVLFLPVYLSVWHASSCLGAPGLLSATCWFLFFCQFTCLSETLRLDVSD